MIDESAPRTAAARFWDKKILGWERARYDTSAPNSVQFRLALASRILEKRVIGQTVLDLGCGSGRLLRQLEPHGPRRLLGIDFSLAAIREARSKSPSDRFDFQHRGVLDGPLPEADWVVGLGLLDWLEESAIESLFAAIGHRHFLLSFSERRPSFLRLLHAAYVRASYGWRRDSYLPRYWDAERILALAGRGPHGPARILRHSRMSFGCLVGSFPLEGK